MKIDLHTHILPREWPDLDAKYGYGGFVRLEHYRPCCARMMIGDRFFREIGDNVWDPARRIEECDRAGVTIQVLSTVPVMFSYWAKPADALDLSRRLNDHIAEVVRAHPDAFRRARHDPAARPGSWPRMNWSAASASSACAASRSAPMSTRTRILRPARLPQSRRPIARRGLERGGEIRRRDLRSSVGHGGQRPDAEILAAVARRDAGGNVARHLLDDFRRSVRALSRICASLSRMAAALSRSPLVGSNTVSRSGPILSRSITRSTHAITSRGRRAGDHGRRVSMSIRWSTIPKHCASFCRLFGVERVALGSDYPFPLGEAHPGALIESMADLSTDEKARLLSGTAREFLRLY